LPENPQDLGAEVVFMSVIGNNMSDVYLKVLSTLARYLTKSSQADAFFEAARNGKAALWKHLEAGNLSLREVVTAEDVMSKADVTVNENAPLSEAFDLFNTHHRNFLPVVVAEGRLKGELSAQAVIKGFCPEYVFMMENLNFLNNFSVFNEIFHSEHGLPVSKYMDSNPVMTSPETPLLQLTLQLLREDKGEVYIVDNNGVLRGIFDINNIISKVLRG
jgi:CBS domain-containing protein